MPRRQSAGMSSRARARDHLGQRRLGLRRAMAAAEQSVGERLHAVIGALTQGDWRKSWSSPWCTNKPMSLRLVARRVLYDPDGDWHAEPGHPVEHVACDLRQAASSRASTRRSVSPSRSLRCCPARW
jgi:hypothetical protein